MGENHQDDLFPFPSAFYIISYSKKGSSGRVPFTETENVIMKKRGAICELRHLPADQPFAHLRQHR